MLKIRNFETLMALVFDLKKEPRVGWNMEPGEGDTFKPRRVQNAESVADHTFGCIAMCLALAQFYKKVRIDWFKVMVMLVIHDLVEARAHDMVTATISDPIKRAQAIKEKHEKEVFHMQAIAYELGGEGGWQAYIIWEEYDKGETPEAMMAKRIDKLEVAFQAVGYREKGEVLDPMEFIITAREKVRDDPMLLGYLDDLEERAFKAG